MKIVSDMVHPQPSQLHSQAEGTVYAYEELKETEGLSTSL